MDSSFENREQIGEKLKDYRVKLKLSMEEVAQKIGISTSTISHYENGKSTPALDTLFMLLKVYQITLLQFLEIDEIDYSKSKEVFAEYGLSQSFFYEILLCRKFAGYRATTDCINLLFEYPMQTHMLFEELKQFFTLSYHEQVNSIPVKFPINASKRLLLEPVIETLCHIFDKQHPEYQQKQLSIITSAAKDRKVTGDGRSWTHEKADAAVCA